MRGAEYEKEATAAGVGGEVATVAAAPIIDTDMFKPTPTPGRVVKVMEVWEWARMTPAPEVPNPHDATTGGTDVPSDPREEETQAPQGPSMVLPPPPGVS